MAGWLTAPLQLHSSREFMCMDFTEEQCEYYQYSWRFWYRADYVYALPTIAFFMCAIGIFTIGHVISQLLALRHNAESSIWRRVIALVRYLSYRGFHVKSLRWNSAPVGVLLLALAGTTYFFCMDLIPQPYYWPSLDWGSSPPLATRSGWMALACMPFIFATASKANWITLLTGVPHEKLQVFHRWISYAFFILALLHTFPFIVFHIREHDMVEQVKSGLIFYWTGIVALIFQAWLTFASFSSFRNWNYEFFKAAHFFAAVVFVLIFFWHCDYTLTSWDYFIATAAVYVPSLAYSWLRTFLEYGNGQKAQIFVEENGFTRITIPANFDWLPGQHCFLRFRSFGLNALTSHPFTICSLPSTSSGEPSSITFYIRHRGGLTKRLYDHALKHPGVSIPVFVDGPYGGIDPQKYHRSDRLVVIAGGSGAGWILPFVEQFVRYNYPATNADHAESEHDNEKNLLASNQNRVPHRRTGPSSLRVILATRDLVTRAWFHQAVEDRLVQYSLTTANQLSNVEVQIHLTGDAEQGVSSSKVVDDLESSEASSTEDFRKPNKTNETAEDNTNKNVEQEKRGRPQLPSIIQEEAAMASQKGESLGVFVCGPDTMQNDVRNAVALENFNLMRRPNSGGVYLHLEHFSWA